MLKLMKYLKPFKISIIFIVVLVFIQALTDLKLPDLMSEIIDIGIIKGNINYIWDTGKIMLIVTLIGTICSLVSGFLSSKTAVGLGRNLRSIVFSHIEGFSLNEFDKLSTASLITRTTNDIQQVQTVLLMLLRIALSAPMTCIGGIIMAVRKDVGLSWILVSIIPVLAIIISVIAIKAIPLYKSMQLKLDNLNLVAREGLTGIRVIRAFNRINHQNQRFDKSNSDLTNTAIKVNRIMASMMPLMFLVLNFTNIGIVWFGAHRINAGEMHVGDMMAFFQYAAQILFSLIMFSMVFVMIPRASASAIRINEVLETKPEIVDIEETKNQEIKKGYLEFRNVSFSFHGAEAPAISNISFSAKPGETTAIIGGTGSGKSTLINLIPRFYDIQSGQILLDDIDIKEMKQSDLREKIGYVPQKAVLFSGSIKENLLFGKKEATEAELIKSAEIAQAIDFIKEMKDGFEAVLSQGGNNISGGQKQRLSIARALIKKPEIYIFDDSFSALDFKTDAKLREALKKETINSTVIIVAQRVSTIMEADRIIVLDDGLIAGIGSHKELIGNCDVYKEIVYSQLSEEEIA